MTSTSTDILEKLMAEAMPGIAEMNDHELLLLLINNLAVLGKQIEGDNGEGGLCGDMKSTSDKVIRLEKCLLVVYILIVILYGRALLPLFPLL
jgi:hypothetical protein